MINLPYVFRNTHFSGNTQWQTELPAKLCGFDQAIWMTARRDTLSGTSTNNSIAPCNACVTRWKDQSVNTNTATLLNSASASGDTEYYSDFWTGDSTTNYNNFVSFDRKTFGPDTNNFLDIPYDASFSELTVLTFSVIFRTRLIEPNPTTEPDDGQGAQVVLFQNGNSTDGFRTDGWGIDFGTASNDLRVWYYDNTATGPVCDAGVSSGNSIILPVSDWTKWMRLTVRISGNTMEANLYNQVEFSGNSGFTWSGGCNNGSGSGIKYGVLWPSQPNWFIAAQKGPDFPGVGNDQVILAGSWDIAEYILYNNWLPDSCVQTIWDYYNFRYNI
jgi:hypothetical protein